MKSVQASSSATSDLLKDLFLQIDVPIILIDNKLNVLQLNPAAEKVAGPGGEKMVGRSMADVFDLDRKSRQELKSWKAKPSAQGDERGQPFTLTSRQKPDVPIQGYRKHMLSGSGQEMFLLSIRRGMWEPEYRYMAYALEAAEERFNVLLRESSDPILILSMKGDILLANPSFEQMTGITSSQLFEGSRGWADFAHESDLPAVLESLKRCEAEEKDNLAEFRIKTSTGNLIWFEQSHSILHDENGRARGIMAVARDVNRRKQQVVELREKAEDMLRRHQRARELIARLKLFFEKTAALPQDFDGFLNGVCDILFEMYRPLMVVLTLASTRRCFVRAQSGVPREIIENPLEKLPCAICEQVIQTGMPYYGYNLDEGQTCKCLDTIGALKLKTCLSAPLIDVKSKNQGSITLLDTESRSFGSLDVELVTVAALQVASRLRAEEQESIQHELEDHLRQSQKMEAVGMLAGGIAHDFNNILSGILGFTSYLLSKTAAGTDLYRDLNMIDQSATRAADLTRQLLSFARRRHFAKEPISLNTIIEGVVGILKHSIAKNVTIEKNLDSNLPMILGDPGQVNQVVMNLCLNAAEAMSGKNGKLTITTEHRHLTSREEAVLVAVKNKTAEYVCLTVQDIGKGMSPDVLAHVFDPFFTTKSDRGGTGLGLSIVYGIVSNHQGDISVESVEGEGTTIRVYFPAHETKTAPKMRAHGRKLDGTETILIVDDEQIVRQMVVAVLKRHGYKVISAASGEEGIEYFKGLLGRIDLVLLDLVMPGMGGEATFEALRELDQKAKVLLTSGFVQENVGERLIKRGAKGMVYKPYKSEQLLGAIRDILDKKPA